MNTAVMAAFASTPWWLEADVNTRVQVGTCEPKIVDEKEVIQWLIPTCSAR
jgi:hypothetical protein